MVKLATELLLAVACVQIMEVVKEEEEEDLAFVQVMEVVNGIGVKTRFQSGEKRQSEMTFTFTLQEKLQRLG